MGRIRQSFVLFKRLSTAKNAKKGAGIWYYQTYDIHGVRTVAKSTSHGSRTKAEEYCYRLFKEDRLNSPRAPFLSDYIASRHFYEWDDSGPLCKYTKERLAESKPGHPEIGRSHVDKCKQYIENHVIPYFGNRRLDAIQQKHIRDWRQELVDEGLSHKTVNNISSAFHVIIKQAINDNLIKIDPWEAIRSLGIGDGREGSLSQEEALLLMNPRTIDTVWNGNMVYYLVNLTAMVTAMRAGEILALRKQDVFPDHIDVNGAWKREHRERGYTKTKTSHYISIPSYLYDAITGFATWDGYLFSFDGGKFPTHTPNVLRELYKALEKIGIDRELAKKRNLCFHSWRRFANSYMRNKGISDAKVQALTGHQTQEMTDHYTDWSSESFHEVASAQNDLVKQLLAKG